MEVVFSLDIDRGPDAAGFPKVLDQPGNL